jgi:hypothetical protein
LPPYPAKVPRRVDTLAKDVGLWFLLLTQFVVPEMMGEASAFGGLLLPTVEDPVQL